MSNIIQGVGEVHLFMVSSYRHINLIGNTLNEYEAVIGAEINMAK